MSLEETEQPRAGPEMDAIRHLRQLHRITSMQLEQETTRGAGRRKLQKHLRMVRFAAHLVVKTNEKREAEEKKREDHDFTIRFTPDQTQVHTACHPLPLHRQQREHRFALWASLSFPALSILVPDVGP